ncbi:Electron transport complex subunit RsxC [BD1-7 clade bacterium]|uniref:Electron transport complex subunit RsxC n=1 Tax=BD1-7 clade bacterium TaxID=2029982 RepID=A0A5S9QZP6_9GAMM|nr:Electron transport complex subunit RsxC [BD1-7 clade bacterium]
MSGLVQQVREAGIVGAGGAGFPTYMKIDVKVDVVIANGAECEPLLNKDQVIMQHHTDDFLDGLQLVMAQCGATKGVIGIKKKHQHSIDVLSGRLPANIELMLMENVYPAGDEYELVYEATGQRIPAGGLPKDIGVLVQNVETLYNVCRATKALPVTHSLISVHGEVVNPKTAWFPVGTTYRDAINSAGGLLCDDVVIIEGGPMMGSVTQDLDTPITRTGSGILAVKADSVLARRKSAPEKEYRRIGKSACDQCSLCTEMCPRYLLGYPIKPHLVMRSLLTSGETSETLSINAQACCECNICSLWACPEMLDPRNVCATTKRDLKANDNWMSAEQLQAKMVDVHPMREYRGVPTARLIRRLGLNGYDKIKAGFDDTQFHPQTVVIPLQQHIGAPANLSVAIGDVVEVGDVIATAPLDAMCVPMHASIRGTVTAADTTQVTIQAAV